MSLALAVFIKRPQADAQIGVKDNIWHSNMYVNLTFGGLAEQRSKDSRTEEMVEEIFKENQIEPPSKDKLPEIPAQAFKRRKVFYKSDDELRDQKKKTS